MLSKFTFTIEYLAIDDVWLPMASNAEYADAQATRRWLSTGATGEPSGLKIRIIAEKE